MPEQEPKPKDHEKRNLALKALVVLVALGLIAGSGNPEGATRFLLGASILAVAIGLSG